MKKINRIGWLVLIACAMAGASSATLVWEDSFTRADNSSLGTVETSGYTWLEHNVNGSDVTINSGALTFENTNSNWTSTQGGGARVNYDTTALTSGNSLEITGQLLQDAGADADSRTFVSLFRANSTSYAFIGSGDNYSVSFAPNGGGKIALYEVVAGSATKLTEATLGSFNNDWRNFSIIAAYDGSGLNFKISLENDSGVLTEVIDFTDTTPTRLTGYISVGANVRSPSHIAQYDDLMVNTSAQIVSAGVISVGDLITSDDFTVAGDLHLRNLSGYEWAEESAGNKAATVTNGVLAFNHTTGACGMRGKPTSTDAVRADFVLDFDYIYGMTAYESSSLVVNYRMSGGVIKKVSSGADGYGLYIDRPSETSLRLRIRDKDGFLVTNTVTVADWNSANAISLRVLDNLHEVYVNGVLEMTLTNNTYSAAGYWNFQDGGTSSIRSIDNMVYSESVTGSVWAEIISITSISDTVVELVVSCNNPSLCFPKSSMDLTGSTVWSSVGHSTNGLAPFLVTNLDYSIASGTNFTIYAEANLDKKFFKIGDE